MAKNDYLSRQRAREQEVFDAGLRIGRQQMCDYLSLALREAHYQGHQQGARHHVPVCARL